MLSINSEKTLVDVTNTAVYLLDVVQKYILEDKKCRMPTLKTLRLETVLILDRIAEKTSEIEEKDNIAKIILDKLFNYDMDLIGVQEMWDALVRTIKFATDCIIKKSAI